MSRNLTYKHITLHTHLLTRLFSLLSYETERHRLCGSSADIALHPRSIVISSLKTVGVFLVCRINLTVSENEEVNVRVKFICQGQYPTVKVKVVQRHSVTSCSLQECKK